MKVLHIVDSLGLGGAQTVVKGIFEKQQGNQNIFLYALRKRDINIQVDHKNLNYYNSKNKFSFPLFTLKNIIKKNGIDLIHCHLAKSQIIGWVLKILFFPKIKLVFHEHGQIFENGKIYPFFMNYFRGEVDLYIAVSQATKNTILLKTKFEENKIKVLYNFVDLDKFKKIENFNRTKILKQYGFQSNDFVIGFASRLVYKKGWNEFINSAKKIVKLGYNLKFLIAGDGNDRELLLKNIQGYELNIKYIGYMDNMVEFYNTIDCFVFPSHLESMGITGIEANACLCPVIASNIEGLNEVMVDRENVLLFEKGDIKGLIEKIIQIYEDANIRKYIIEKGYIDVKKYSLETYLFELNKIYEGM